jgi:hypothetical protein
MQRLAFVQAAREVSERELDHRGSLHVQLVGQFLQRLVRLVAEAELSLLFLGHDGDDPPDYRFCKSHARAHRNTVLQMGYICHPFAICFADY